MESFQKGVIYQDARLQLEISEFYETVYSYYTCSCFQWAYNMETPDILVTIYYLFQKICLSPKPPLTFCITPVF